MCAYISLVALWLKFLKKLSKINIYIYSTNKIKVKINNIRIILGRLGNIVTKDDRNKIRKERYEIEKKQGRAKVQKERIYNRLMELANILDKKENYKYNDYDDLDYFGIKDLENLFNNISDVDYYKHH